RARFNPKPRSWGPFWEGNRVRGGTPAAVHSLAVHSQGVHSPGVGRRSGRCGRVNAVPERLPSFPLECLPVLPVVDLRGSDRDPAGLLPRAPADAVEAARAGVRELVEGGAARGGAPVAAAAR